MAVHALLKPSPDCSRPSCAPTTAAAATLDRLSATRLSLRLSPLFKSRALWTLKSCALWTPQKLCFMRFMDTSKVVLYVLYGHFKRCALWTLQKLCFMDLSEVVLYGVFRSCALWILQKLCFLRWTPSCRWTTYLCLLLSFISRSVPTDKRWQIRRRLLMWKNTTTKRHKQTQMSQPIFKFHRLTVV